MKRIPSVFVLAAFALFMSAAAFAQDTTATKETPAQERAEEKHEKAEKAHKVKAPKMHVDLNTASKEDLTKLPGVTDDLADKIIAGRPYSSKGQLVSKGILTKAEYKMVRGKVWAKKEKEAGATAK